MLLKKIKKKLNYNDKLKVLFHAYSLKESVNPRFNLNHVYNFISPICFDFILNKFGSNTRFFKLVTMFPAYKESSPAPGTSGN